MTETLTSDALVTRLTGLPATRQVVAIAGAPGSGA